MLPCNANHSTGWSSPATRPHAEATCTADGFRGTRGAPVGRDGLDLGTDQLGCITTLAACAELSGEGYVAIRAVGAVSVIWELVVSDGAVG